MGYRHQVISDTMVPGKNSLPKWFLDKYEGTINFDMDYWASYKELKRYMVLSDFDTDVQKVLVELGTKDKIRLVYFADEGSEYDPDIIHTTITVDNIKEIRPGDWSE